jgi:beta-carotene 15,15'-dioxygenase
MARPWPQAEMTFARRVAPLGIASVGWSLVPSDRLSLSQTAHAILTAGALVASAMGVTLDTPMMSVLMSAAMLLFGLPHGTLDVALIQTSRSHSKAAAVVALYLGCAAVMYAAWRVNAGVALLVFLGLSIRHFAEDWADRLPPIFAHGVVTALITAPALMYAVALEALISFLIGRALAATIVDVAILIAPLAIVVACVGIISLWTDGHRTCAIATGLSLVGMLWLPPLIGFTLFFCLMHSPTQFSTGLKVLGWQRSRQWAGVVVPLTLAALGLAGAIYINLPVKTVSQAMVTTSFVTLSVLTLPHMIVPYLVKRFVTATAKGPYRDNALRGA